MGLKVVQVMSTIGTTSTPSFVKKVTLQFFVDLIFK